MYVVEMIVCSIYGYLLRNRDKNECTKIASLILNNFYVDGKAPYDILERQWTMLILQYADYLNGDQTFLEKNKHSVQDRDPYSLISSRLDGDKVISDRLMVQKDIIIHYAFF